MKFLVDADSPYSLVEIFRKRGYDAVHVKEIGIIDDEKIFEYANKNNYIIVTKDLGFADLFISNGGFGLILIRLPYYFKLEKVKVILNKFLESINPNELLKSITVVELDRYRIKKLEI